MKNFGKFVYSLLLFVSIAIFSGWCLMLSYNMLITKIFEIKEIPLIYGISFSMLFLLLSYKKPDIKKDYSMEELTKVFLKNVAGKLLILLMIYITSLFL